MPADSRNETQDRLTMLKHLVREGEPSTQEELCEGLLKKGFEVTQSTVSRDLRRIGAVKATNEEGEIIYVMPEDHQALRPRVTASLVGLVLEIQSNENMIVLHTSPGSASLVARHIDTLKETLGVLGTVAGDDTVLVVPKSVKKIPSVVEGLEGEFQ